MRVSVLVSVLAVTLVAGLALRRSSRSTRSTQVYAPYPKGTLTFNKDIAPIVFKQCAGCHRPGQSAPFSLLSFGEVKKRAKQIVEVTAKRLMPPWLPEPGYGEFADARLLSVEVRGAIAQWVAEGAIEGDANDLPELPKWVEGWQLGEPDLVVKMAESYSLAAEGKDVYRNFVIAVPVTETRFVKAVEFRPGNPKIVHHAVMQIDRTSSSKLLDEHDPEPGFGGGMGLGKAQLPDGFFLGWTPGRLPFKGTAGMAWRLDAGTDIVLQLHMRPTGKSESIQPVIGLYFAEAPPTLAPYPLVLRSKLIDIPAGKSNYVVEQACELPVDVEALGIYPHAHYLATEMKAIATLPDGTSQWLMRIKEWNFEWQDEYRYAKPIFLPKGTRISMRYLYDNSTGNIRNPNNPPKPVLYGQNSSDEMAELMIQVLPRNGEDLSTLREYSAYRAIMEEIARDEERLNLDPIDPKAHLHLGLRYQQISKMEEAIAHFRRALEIEPSAAKGHYLLGDALSHAGKFDDALKEFQKADRLEPNQPETLNALALIFTSHPNPSLRDPTNAIHLAKRACELTQSKDPVILETLAMAYAGADQFEKAVESGDSAIKAAVGAQAHELANEIRERLDRYKRTKSVREQ